MKLFQTDLCQYMLHLTVFHFSYMKYQCHLPSHSSHKTDTSYFSSNRSCHCESAYITATTWNMVGSYQTTQTTLFLVSKGCEIKVMPSERNRQQHGSLPAAYERFTFLCNVKCPLYRNKRKKNPCCMKQRQKVYGYFRTFLLICINVYFWFTRIYAHQESYICVIYHPRSLPHRGVVAISCRMLILTWSRAPKGSSWVQNLRQILSFFQQLCTYYQQIFNTNFHMVLSSQT